MAALFAPLIVLARVEALPTQTKVEDGTSPSKSGTSVIFSNSGSREWLIVPPPSQKWAQRLRHKWRQQLRPSRTCQTLACSFSSSTLFFCDCSVCIADWSTFFSDCSICSGDCSTSSRLTVPPPSQRWALRRRHKWCQQLRPSRTCQTFKPKVAQYPESTEMTYIFSRGGPFSARSSHLRPPRNGRSAWGTAFATSGVSSRGPQERAKHRRARPRAPNRQYPPHEQGPPNPES